MSKSNKNILITVLYAQQDERFWLDLKDHLRAIARKSSNSHVEIWSVQDVELAGEVRQTIRTQLSRSDMTILLLSAKFISEEILDEEVRIMLRNFAAQERRERHILPVIIRDFDWEDSYDDAFDIKQLKVFDEIVEDSDELTDAALERKRNRVYMQIAEEVEQFVDAVNERSINVVLPTWVGFTPAIMYNDGFVRNKRTPLYEQFKRTARFSLNDKVEDTCQALINGEADLIWATLDRLPDVLERLKDLRPKVIFQASWSAGADAIVARRHIETINDLRGRKVLFPSDSPCFTFLKFILREQGISIIDDGIQLEARKHGDLNLLVNEFEADETIDAIVVWSPYVETCMDRVSGTKILAHTGNYPRLIADVLVANENYVQLNTEELILMFRGWFKMIEDYSAPDLQPALLNPLVTAILKPLPGIIPRSIRHDLETSLLNYFAKSLEKVRLCTLEDNRDFFNLPGANGDSSEELFRKFLEMDGLSMGDRQWSDILDSRIIEGVIDLIATESNGS